MTDTETTVDGGDMTIEEAGRVFVDSSAFTQPARFHAAAAKLRAEDPVHWVESPSVYPFYVVTRHADVLEVEHHHEVFLNEPRSVLGSKGADDARVAMGGHLIKSLIAMDGEEHKAHRDVVRHWFRPGNLKRLQSGVDELSQSLIQKMVDAGGEIDFATEIAMEYPLRVILSILGLPESDYPRMLQLTQELFGAEDPEFKRDDDSLAGVMATVAEFVAYFDDITAKRRANPTEDLASVIAHAEVDGKPIGHMEQLGLYIITATAGHDTTSASIAGGMQALIENPDQLELLRQNPDLLRSAVEEIVRWTSPVKHFMRTANADYQLGDTLIKEGQDVLLSYWSANRDEAVFDDPLRFDVTRDPNNQVAFGFGVHFCLGVMLAKMELRSFFGALIPRLNSVELAGDPELVRSLFVSGPKHLPIKYDLS
jgi:cytochrome P450